VPKERFIFYPGASPDSDGSLLLGWAGWDHREQAHALITLIEERSATDSWDVGRLKPLLAGLAEIMPWVRQWHAETDEHFGTSPADAYDTYLTAQREKYGLAEEDLHKLEALAASSWPQAHPRVNLHVVHDSYRPNKPREGPGLAG